VQIKNGSSFDYNSTFHFDALTETLYVNSISSVLSCADLSGGDLTIRAGRGLIMYGQSGEHLKFHSTGMVDITSFQGPMRLHAESHVHFHANSRIYGETPDSFVVRHFPDDGDSDETLIIKTNDDERFMLNADTNIPLMRVNKYSGLKLWRDGNESVEFNNDQDEFIQFWNDSGNRVIEGNRSNEYMKFNVNDDTSRFYQIDWDGGMRAYPCYDNPIDTPNPEFRIFQTSTNVTGAWTLPNPASYTGKRYWFTNFNTSFETYVDISVETASSNQLFHSRGYNDSFRLYYAESWVIQSNGTTWIEIMRYQAVT
jgi:hypothetical protein